MSSPASKQGKSEDNTPTDIISVHVSTCATAAIPTNTDQLYALLALLFFLMVERAAITGYFMVFVLYFLQMFDWSSSLANAASQTFQAVLYLFAAIFAITSDAWLGRLSTTKFGLVGYFFGYLLTFLSSLPFAWQSFPYTPGPLSYSLFFIGFFLLGVSHATTRACMNVIIADQAQKLKDTTEDNSRLVERIFRYNAAACNAGPIISVIVVPLVRQYGQLKIRGTDFPSEHISSHVKMSVGTSYYYSFAICGGLYIIGMIVFLMYVKMYPSNVPDKNSNTLLQISSALKSALRNNNKCKKLRIKRTAPGDHRIRTLKPNQPSDHDQVDDHSIVISSECTDITDQHSSNQAHIHPPSHHYELMTISKKCPYRYSMLSHDSSNASDQTNMALNMTCELCLLDHCDQKYESLIADLTRISHVIPLFLVFMSLYFMSFSQFQSAVIIQADWMFRPSWFEPEHLMAIGCLTAVILVPIQDFGITFLQTHHGKVFKLGPQKRLSWGLGTIAAAMLYETVLQVFVRSKGGYNTNGVFSSSISVWWLIIYIILISWGVILTSSSALEYAYKTAPVYLKGTLTAMVMFSFFLGSILSVAVSPSVTPANLEYLFGSLTCVMMLSCLLHIVFFSKYDHNAAL